jgi:KDO2-lipid IV(A) lauroyltransferase
LVKYRQLGKPILIGFIADQTPVYDNIHYWTSFLNHPETPVFTGAEKIMQKFDMDVYYLDVRRIRRGHYVAEYKLITTEPKTYQEFELTEIYTKLMEHTINRAPAYWLWSHNRWKRTKEGYYKQYPNRRPV